MAQSEHVEQFSPGLEYPVISYGLPFPQACAKNAKELGCSRVFVICSRTLSAKTDALQRLEAALGKDLVGIRRGLKSNTMFSELLEVAAEVERTRADCNITVGGGSIVNSAKFMPFAIANNARTVEDLTAIMKRSLDYMKITGSPIKDWRGAFAQSTISVMSVPTTLSGGEFNARGGGTSDIDMHKQLGIDPSSPGPKVIIWDPELVMTTPLRVWLSTGMRAVDHIVESYCSSTFIPDGIEPTRRGLNLLIPGLLRTKQNPDGLDARLEAQKGGRESMKLIRIGAMAGGSHGIGHQLGPYGVPHGETTCVMLPSVLKYNARVNRERQQELLAILWESDVTAEVLRKHGIKKGRTGELGDAIGAVITELGMPRTLGEVGIKKDKFEIIAESSLRDKSCELNPIPLTKKEQVMEILEMAA